MSVASYIESLPEERQIIIQRFRETIQKNLPKGFEECMSYGMIGYVVPHSIYPKGYHCDAKLPLPFLNIASQKNFVALYHMGLYADEAIMKWFIEEFPKHSASKLDMGKSCIRFKKIEHIPFDLIGQLSQKFSPKQWIELYESKFLNVKK